MNNRFLPHDSPGKDGQAGAGNANPCNVPKIHYVSFSLLGFQGTTREGKVKNSQNKTQNSSWK